MKGIRQIILRLYMCCFFKLQPTVKFMQLDPVPEKYAVDAQLIDGIH